tara:strand:- start:41 stop:1003 length:963 start_codon:yes stop_codon:yes gene_type:complete
MKLGNRLILVLVAAVAIYAIFLFTSDYDLISEKISDFKVNYLPLILFLVAVSWVPLIIRWNFLLKNCEIDIPLTKSILIFLSGLAFEITPGHVGVLMKSQILKTSYNISRTKTVPIVLVEKMYDLIGAILASAMGIIILGMDFHLIIIAILVLTIVFFIIYYRPASKLFIKRVTKTKFFSKYVENISEFDKIVQKSTNVKIATICILLAVTYWFIVSTAVYYTLIAFDVNILDYLKVLAIYTTSVLLGAVSFIPGGVGITEGTIAGLLSLEGIDISIALVLSVMIRIFTLGFAVVVGFISLKFTGGFSFKKDFPKESKTF